MNFRGGPGGRGRRAAAVVDITALVDVVFQLLIFFLLTSSYVSQQGAAAPRVPVDLPESSLTADPSQVDDLTISIDAEGELFVGEDERVSLEELGVRLTKAANENPNTLVLIRADKSVPHGRVSEVMALARAARLRISVMLRGGG